jgi:hypothetical protein
MILPAGDFILTTQGAIPKEDLYYLSPLFYVTPQKSTINLLTSPEDFIENINPFM